MMFRSLSLTLAAVTIMTSTTTDAFVPRAFSRVAVSPSSFVLSSTKASVENINIAAAVQNAIQTANKHGAGSPEARLAWEKVEELASIDNDVSKGSLMNECSLTDEEMTQACQEYGEKMDALKLLMEDYAPKMANLKLLAEELQSIKLNVASAGKPGADSPALREALAAAKKAESDFGAGSPEAKVAWAELEEIASAGLSNAMGPNLDDECLVESTLQACQNLEELNRALNLNKIQGDGLSNF